MRTQCEPMRPHLCHRHSDSVCSVQDSWFCLSLVRVPESRVNEGSSFLWGGEVYSGGEVLGGLFGQRSSV